jgi:hypothetical protein
MLLDFWRIVVGPIVDPALVTAADATSFIF